MKVRLRYSPYGDAGGIQLEVARAAEKSRPREALGIYRTHAERLIAMQGRQAYREACGYLKKVRALAEQLGEEGMWAEYVAGLREKHRRLCALQEELRDARL